MNNQDSNNEAKGTVASHELDSERQSVDALSEAIEFAERVGPLPRCAHGNALKDGAGDYLEPSCGCLGTAASPCPWCGAMADAEDEWGSLITHKPTCYWLNIHGDPIGRVRVNNSEKRQWNTRTAVWQPIESAPKGEEWCIVGKIAASGPNEGQLLWWYRAMFWRGGWHTSRSYDTRIAPSHYLPLAAPTEVAPARDAGTTTDR